MKKILWIISYSLLCVACDKDCEDPIITPMPDNDTTIVAPLNVKDYIIGEWVVDYAIDDPKGYRWEIVKFLESGTIYFSNYSDKSSTSHNYVNGTYTIDGNVIKTNCQLGWSNLYETYNAEIHVSQIDEFTLKADIFIGGNVVESNTYIKVVDKIEIVGGEIQPDYAKMFVGKTIKGFKSHNNYIATVDENTGRINSEWSGSTYIDIITDKGTAAVQITVNSILYFDYEEYVGSTMKDIVNIFNRQDSVDANILFYKYNENYYPSLQQKSGNWNSMSVRLNNISGFVDKISLEAKEDVWFTEYQISDYLSEKYTMYQRTTEYNEEVGIPLSEFEKRKDYYIGNSLEEAKVGVTWNSELKVLNFVDLKDEHRNTIDYGHFMCMTAEDIKIIMGEPDYHNANEWMAYHIGGRYTNIIKFSFRNRDTNKIKKTVQEVDVFLYSDIDINSAVSTLDEKYEFSDEKSDTRIYTSSTPKMMIDIWLGNNTKTKLIQYLYKGIDINDEGRWPEYAEVVLHNVDDVKGAMGEPIETTTGQMVFHSYWFMGVFWYYDINGNDYIKRVAVNRNMYSANATNIAVFLKDGVDHSDIADYLGSLYDYQEQNSVPNEGIFVYKKKISYVDVWIEYDSVNGAIYYFRK